MHHVGVTNLLIRLCQILLLRTRNNKKTSRNWFGDASGVQVNHLCLMLYLHCGIYCWQKERIAQGIWRPVLGPLQLLLHAVPLYGIQPPSRTGFPSDALMNFVTQAFNIPNGEVRNAAIKVTTEVYRLMGPPIDKYLKGIKPLIREVPFPPQVILIWR
jgi:hypothetical protein